MIRRLIACLVLAGAGSAGPGGGASGPANGNAVELHPERMPRTLWARELVWLHNIGISSVAAADAPQEFLAIAAAEGIQAGQPPANALRVSALSPNAGIESRRAMVAGKAVLWTDVESESGPVFHAGAVSFAGDELASLNPLRREASLWLYWSAVLSGRSGAGPGQGHAAAPGRRMPETVSVTRFQTAAASAVNVLNNGKDEWRGALRAYLPTYKRDVEIPDVTVPGKDALWLPVDISLADPHYCRKCSGMANSERLLYATAELTAIEYENGLLSFEFYAPHAGTALLQLEREPDGPMIAGGKPVAFDWDPETKRARLPIPASRNRDKSMRIAITIAGPDEDSSFQSVHTLVIGQKNEVLTDYTSEALAKRSRLVAPEGWKTTGQPKSPKEITYAVEVPANKLHGDQAELRLEADGISMSHVRVRLLRPASVHVAEASPLRFGAAMELAADPPVIPVEAPGGRNISVKLRNNAPEIRTFQVELTGEGIEFSPAKEEISIGASMERELSYRVFVNRAEAGTHTAEVHVTGAADLTERLLFVVIPRGQAAVYEADLLGLGGAQTIWENTRIRAVFERPDGGRWIELYWKESGKSLLPAEGIALPKPVKVGLDGDSLLIDGASGLPRGGKAGNVEWKAQVEGSVTRYTVLEASGAK